MKNKNLLAEQSLRSNFSTDFYASVESSFGSITEHTIFLAKYIVRKFSPCSSKDSLLDIGSGPGFTVEKLLNNYQSVIAIDPNDFYLIYYERLKLNSNFDYILGNFENIDFFKKFTTILCSHVLYHVPQIEWGSFVLKISNLLETNGSALLTLVAPKGPFHELCYEINPRYSNSSILCSVLENLGIHYEKQLIKAQFREKDKQKYANLVSMFAIDDCFNPSEYLALSDARKKEIESLISDFIDKSYSKKLDSYFLETKEEYIVIKKS